DDRVERGAQLVAHAREELRLVLARQLQLAALVLDLVEQPHVLDRDRSLVGERLDQRNLFVSERLNLRLDETNDALWNSFAEHRDSKHRPKRKHFLRLGECVFGVCPDVDYLHRAAFEQSSAHRGSTASADGGTLPKLQKFRRYIMRGHRVARIAVVTENHSSCCAAEPDSRTQESIEHGLQIEGRAADDLEHVGGGGLLLQRLAQFFEQARVLDRDDGLCGEVLDQLDLLVRERADLLAIDADRADQLILLDHRGDKERAGTGEVDESNNQRIAFAVRRHRPKVVDVHDLPGPEHLSMAAPWRGTEWLVSP